MGLRYRKSIKMPLGFRINLSKSGIGYSYGFKGYRHTVKANGGTRDTFNIPGTGLSYVNENRANHQNNNNNTNIDGNVQNAKLIQNINMINSSYDSVCNKLEQMVNKTISRYNTFHSLCITSLVATGQFIFVQLCLNYNTNKNSELNRYCNVALVVIIILLLFMSFIFLICKNHCKNKRKVNIEYSMDDSTYFDFCNMRNNWNVLLGANRTWSVLASMDARRRTNAGASTIITRQIIYPNIQNPWFINSNIQPISFDLKDYKMYMYPDVIMILQGGKVSFKSYGNMRFRFSYTSFRENTVVSSDATIIGKTWQFVNKDGSPDKRFKNNRQVPICKYGEVSIMSNDINMQLMVSDHTRVAHIENLSRKSNNVLIMNGQRQKYSFNARSLPIDTKGYY